MMISITGRNRNQESGVRGQGSALTKLNPEPCILNPEPCTLYPEPCTLTPANGFSMVELMAAVAIVAVSLILVFRVFFTCSRALSEASYSAAALDVLESKTAELKQASIEGNGLLPSSDSDRIIVGSREIQLDTNISEWGPDILEEGEPVKLCAVELSASWSVRGRTRRLVSKTFMPLEGYRDEF
ncbi:MAG: prepilin-type N-terminal cleavage/methylation domain-containing protein [Candidatus Omnitrophota bacterium]